MMPLTVLIRVLVAFVGGLLLAMPAMAETRALLVAVSDYPTLAERLQLRGPRNDVRRLNAVLQQRGFSPDHITVLADGVPGAAPPTYGRIVGALEAMAASARPGDTLFLYMAGHGSQQPAPPGALTSREEPDGLYETFLPADVGRWDGTAATVQNSIADHQIRRYVARMLDQGAFVWAVFDTCHSATLVRDVATSALADDGEEIRYRNVAPSDLGVPDAAMAAAASAATVDAEVVVRTRGGTSRGGSVFFYAAQTTERTPELRQPPQHPQSRPYGLFSFVLTQLLEQAHSVSYRQLAQAVLAQYAALPYARVTPLFTGTALDAPLLGGRAPAVRQWLLERGGSVAAGALSGLREGALFAVLPSPLASTDAALGFVRAQSVGLSSSIVEPTGYAGRAPPAAAELVPGRTVRLLSNPLAAGLNVALDARACPADCAARAVAQRVRAAGAAGVELRWVDRAADVTLRLLPRQLELIVPGRRTLRVEVGDGAADEVGRQLEMLTRSMHLLRLAAQLAGDAAATGLDISLAHRATSGGATLAPLAGPLAAVRSGDRISVTLTNPRPEALDVTVLYVDQAAGIRVLFPDDAGGSNRLEPGARTVRMLDIDDNSVGLSRLLVLAAPAQRHGERTDYSFLAQSADGSGMSRTPVSTTSQRGAAVSLSSAKTGAEMFTFKVGAQKVP